MRLPTYILSSSKGLWSQPPFCYKVTQLSGQVPEVSQQAVDVKVWPAVAQAEPGVPGKNEAVPRPGRKTLRYKQDISYSPL